MSGHPSKRDANRRTECGESLASIRRHSPLRERQKPEASDAKEDTNGNHEQQDTQLPMPKQGNSYQCEGGDVEVPQKRHVEANRKKKVAPLRLALPEERVSRYQHWSLI